VKKGKVYTGIAVRNVTLQHRYSVTCHPAELTLFTPAEAGTRSGINTVTTCRLHTAVASGVSLTLASLGAIAEGRHVDTSVSEIISRTEQLHRRVAQQRRI